MSENTDRNMQVIENATLDDVRPGDHLTWEETWEVYGVTTAQRREGIAHHRDINGDWCTERGAHITNCWASNGTVTIRRPIPTDD
jgi:hypothetical protein